MEGNGWRGLMHHLAISDHSGNSVVAEYVDQKLVVTKAPVVTNFFLAQGRKTGDWKQAVKEAFFHPGKLSSGK